MHWVATAYCSGKAVELLLTEFVAVFSSSPNRHTGSVVVYLESVSYTHLDVYKRQNLYNRV